MLKEVDATPPGLLNAGFSITIACCPVKLKHIGRTAEQFSHIRSSHHRRCPRLQEQFPRWSACSDFFGLFMSSLWRLSNVGAQLIGNTQKVRIMARSCGVRKAGTKLSLIPD